MLFVHLHFLFPHPLFNSRCHYRWVWLGIRPRFRFWKDVHFFFILIPFYYFCLVFFQWRVKYQNYNKKEKKCNLKGGQNMASTGVQSGPPREEAEPPPFSVLSLTFPCFSHCWGFAWLYYCTDIFYYRDKWKKKKRLQHNSYSKVWNCRVNFITSIVFHLFWFNFAPSQSLLLTPILLDFISVKSYIYA